MVRTLSTVARGSSDPSARRSTTRTAMPCRANVMAAVRPAGPAPITTTGLTPPSDVSILLSFVRRIVF